MYRQTLVNHLQAVKERNGDFSLPLSSFDLETEGLEGKILLAGLSIGSDSYQVKNTPDVLQNSTPLVVMHGGKFDIRRMVQGGYMPPARIYLDTMAAYWMLNEEEKRLGLKAVAPKALGFSDPEWEAGWEENQEDLHGYLKKDLRYTRELMLNLWGKLKQENLLNLFIKLESPMMYLAAEMEATGLRLDREKLEHEWNQSKQRLAKLQHLCRRACPEAPWDCERCAGTGIYTWKRPAGKTSPCRECDGTGQGKFLTSPDQLSTFLFGQLGLAPVAFTKNDNPSTAGASLLRMAYKADHGTARFLRLLDAYRGEGQLFKLFWNVYMEHGGERVHPNWKPWGTKTARFACAEPNLMNVPPRVREVFLPDEGYVFADGDYTQLEMLLAGVLSDEHKILDAYASGTNLHQRTADAVQRDYSVGKTVNFALLYGLGDNSLADRLGISPGLAAEIRAGVLGDYTALDSWLKRTKAECAERGYVTTILGRRRRIPEIHSSSPKARSHAENQAVNSPVQGSAADLMKSAQILTRLNVPQAIPVLQVHDELVCMVPVEDAQQTADEIQHCMENALPSLVKPRVDMRVLERWTK